MLIVGAGWLSMHESRPSRESMSGMWPSSRSNVSCKKLSMESCKTQHSLIGPGQHVRTNQSSMERSLLAGLVENGLGLGPRCLMQGLIHCSIWKAKRMQGPCITVSQIPSHYHAAAVMSTATQTAVASLIQHNPAAITMLARGKLGPFWNIAQHLLSHVTQARSMHTAPSMS